MPSDHPALHRQLLHEAYDDPFIQFHCVILLLFYSLMLHSISLDDPHPVEYLIGDLGLPGVVPAAKQGLIATALYTR
jgi:hypothetical protein